MKTTRKIIGIMLAVLLALSVLSLSSFAEEKASLKFKDDGSFKILMFNDTQDDQKMNKKTEKFLRAAITQEKPDLVVVAGDILSDIWPAVNEKKVDQNINEICGIFEDLGVNYALTFGNHDHDRIDDCTTGEHIMALAASHPHHVDISDGNDPATYSIPVYSHDGREVKYVVYMMDSNNKDAALSMSGYTGLYPEQIEWYKAKAEEYKNNNGGEYVPSTVIQHVPVAEIYDFLKEVPMAEYLDDGVVFSTNDSKWYKLNTWDYPDMTGTLGEAPCSEIVSTGEYQAWTQTGVVSAFFAHDHVNSFAATTKEGIYMGYNGGTGFNSYGFGDERSCRVINIHEDDTSKIDTQIRFYKDVTGEKLLFYPTDILSPVIITKLLKFVCVIPSLFCKIFGI